MAGESSLLFGPFCLDPHAQRVWRENELLDFDPLTFKVLHYFVRHPHQTISRQELLEQVWGYEVSRDEVWQQIYRVRQQLGEGWIRTVRGQGYRFERDVVERARVLEGGVAHQLPSRRNPLFIGRDALLETMRERMTSGYAIALTQAIHGLGGVGKTQLALEYSPDIVRTMMLSGGYGQRGP